MKVRPLTPRELAKSRRRIIVPLTGRTRDALMAQAQKASQAEISAVEWRADLFDDRRNLDELVDIAGDLRKTLGKLPLMFTLRTADEGGKWYGKPDEYVSFIRAVCATGAVDSADVQHTHPKFADAVRAANDNGCTAIGSYHNYESVETLYAMSNRAVDMVTQGADIVKMALTPKDPNDVITLLEFSNFWSDALKVPLITIGMGEIGTVIRVFGYVFGSVTSYCSLDEPTAPGQLDAESMMRMWRSIARESNRKPVDTRIR